MLLDNVIKGHNYQIIQGQTNVEISDIVYDSRKVKEGALFVCVKGSSFDGHKFAREAIKKGAKALIIEKEILVDNKDITIIKVDNARETLSYISNLFYEEPSKGLRMVGITGTNGKTSISFLVSEILQNHQKNVGVIGTIGMQINNVHLDLEKTTPTTPDSLELHMILNEMKMKNATDVVMEVTSIALDQHRVDDCHFDIGIFTNLTEDHLDFHGTMENYKKSKKKLFDLCSQGIINIDDVAGQEFAKSAKCSVMTYAMHCNADLIAENIQLSPNGTKFKLKVNGKTYPIKINLPGKFNVYNALAAIGAGLQLNVPMETIIEALSTIKGARGRFESVTSQGGYTAVVDYAHTPDALENVLLTAKEFKPNKLITVFGCGGDRDTTKRPMMGRISGELSDITIITSDNPRTEEPWKILEEIEEGIKKTEGKYEIIADRKFAIEEAMKMANPGDMVIVAGKGHETYQIFKDTTVHFDDMEIIKNYISI